MNVPNAFSAKIFVCLNAVLCLVLVVFQSGCVSNSFPVCTKDGLEPGVYQVTFSDPSGQMFFEYLTADSSGTIRFGPCAAPADDPVLLPPNSPPDCGQARPSLPKLVASSQDFVDVSIEGITDPDG